MQTLSEAIQTLKTYGGAAGNWIDNTVLFQVDAGRHTLTIEISRKDDCFNDTNGVLIKELSPIQYSVLNAVNILKWIKNFGFVPAVTIVTEEFQRKTKIRCEYQYTAQIGTAADLLECESINVVKVIKHRK